MGEAALQRLNELKKAAPDGFGYVPPNPPKSDGSGTQPGGHIKPPFVRQPGCGFGIRTAYSSAGQPTAVKGVAGWI